MKGKPTIEFDMADSLEQLVARVNTNANIVASFLPSSGVHNSVENAASEPPESVRQARQDLLLASREIQQLVLEPSEYLEQHQVNYQQLSCLQWLLHFDILSKIPLNEAVPFTSIAAAANVPLSRLRSVARMAMTGGMLSEPQPEHVAHSQISAQFVKKPALVDWAKFMVTYSAPTAAKFAEATSRWGDTSEKDQTAYNIAFNTDLPFFKDVVRSQEMSATFAGYMRSLGESEGTAFKHVLTGFDWASLGKARITDVGGSTGQASTLLATHYPELSFLVQDLPSTVASSASILSNFDEAICSRVTFSAHDFFDHQPSSVSSSTDIFFLRKILHDWPFKDAQAILSRISEALQKPGSRIIIMDTILPEPGSVSAMEEAGLRVRDLTMAQSFNNGERELSEWTKLIESVTPKLRLKEWKRPPGSVMSMMVVTKLEDILISS